MSSQPKTPARRRKLAFITKRPTLRSSSVCLEVVVGDKEVKIKIDETGITSRKVLINCTQNWVEGSQQLYPMVQGAHAALGTNGFDKTWHFVAPPKNMNVAGHYVAKPIQFTDYRPCIVKEANPGGSTYTIELMPTPGSGANGEIVTNVLGTSILEKETEKAIKSETHELVLKVEQDNKHAISAKILLNEKDITREFTRPTPAVLPPGPPGAPASKLPDIIAKVSPDRRTVSCNYGEMVLEAQRLGLVFKDTAKIPKATKDKRVWKIKVGAFGEHEIALTRHHGVLTQDRAELTVDGCLLVSATAEDLGGQIWSCPFSLAGAGACTFEVHQTNADGKDTHQVVAETRKLKATKVDCVVTIDNWKTMEESTLEVDSVPWMSLRDPMKEEKYNEKIEDMTASKFEDLVGMKIPTKLDPFASVGFQHDAEEAIHAVQELNFFAWITANFRNMCGCNNKPLVAVDG